MVIPADYMQIMYMDDQLPLEKGGLIRVCQGGSKGVWRSLLNRKGVGG
jgi:hypothetical protein